MHQLLLAIMLALTTTSAMAGNLRSYSGAPLPDFTLMDLQGKQYRLSSLKGKVVMVNFWATYCKPCVKEMPSMERLNDMFRSRPFQIFAIDMAEERTDIETFMKRSSIHVNFPILLDNEGQVAKAWRITAVPTSSIGREPFVISSMAQLNGTVLKWLTLLPSS